MENRRNIENASVLSTVTTLNNCKALFEQKHCARKNGCSNVYFFIVKLKIKFKLFSLHIILHNIFKMIYYKFIIITFTWSDGSDHDKLTCWHVIFDHEIKQKAVIIRDVNDYSSTRLSLSQYDRRLKFSLSINRYKVRHNNEKPLTLLSALNFGLRMKITVFCFLGNF